MRVIPVEGLPEVAHGDDLAALLADAVELEDGDVCCVASTVVSKAAGRTASLEAFPPGPRARELAERLSAIHHDAVDPRFVQAILEEATEVVMEAPFLLTETRFGHVNVNAGIDRSNVGDAELLLLPERPHEHAEAIRDSLEADVAVVLTDTCGRAFRVGQQAVAIGWAGMAPQRDWRGEADRDGYELSATVQCVVDELAGAANLVMGEGADGTPAVVVRDWAFGDHAPGETVFRAVEDDYVRQALRDWRYADG